MIFTARYFYFLFFLLLCSAPVFADQASNGASIPVNTMGVFPTLLLCGVMGLVGQGARTAVGMKTLADYKSSQDASISVFNLSRLVFSLIIGFVAGFVTGLAQWKLIGIDAINVTDFDTMIKFAIAGYIGTDAIEAFTAKFFDPSMSTPATRAGPSMQENQVAAFTTLSGRVDDLAGALQEMSATPQIVTLPAVSDSTDDPLKTITPAIVKKMFPNTPLAPITKNLPYVLDGLRARDLIDRQMILMALSTIRCETEGFVPIDEGISIYNTVSYPFDVYDYPHGKKCGDLGNNTPGDGAKFKGRGYVQLTGRKNYTETGPEVASDLVNHPDLANKPDIAGLILAQFLKDNEHSIRKALAAQDLAAARRAVNGGSHGLPQFADAYNRGLKALPNW